VTSHSLGRRGAALLASLGLVGALFGGIVAPVASAGTASAGSTTCGGSLVAPGVLGSGTYGAVTITGFCFVPPSSTIVISGGLTVASGAFLVASAAFDGVCDRSITIRGGVTVGQGGSLILGDGEGSGCVPNTHTVVNGGLNANGAIDLIIHGVVVNGGLASIGGGDGGPCNFGAPTGPTYLTVEDSQINGGATISGYNACWLGFARNHVNGGVSLQNNILDDPDAMEILANTINGGLSCTGNIAGGVPRATNQGDVGPGGSFVTEPNTVHGAETGQCVGL
jgi:hypothetical protein